MWGNAFNKWSLLALSDVFREIFCCNSNHEHYFAYTKERLSRTSFDVQFCVLRGELLNLCPSTGSYETMSIGSYETMNTGSYRGH